MSTIRWVQNMIWVTWALTGASFIAVTVIGVTECRPTNRYWQIEPNPGTCVKAYAQLLSQCICNIVLDLMLLVISFPVLFARGRTWTQHLRVALLFMLGSFCIGVTIIRLTAVYGNGGAQAARTMWGAVQIIVSTFVANMPTIYGDVTLILRKRRESIRLSELRPENRTRSTADADDESSQDRAMVDKEPAYYEIRGNHETRHNSRIMAKPRDQPSNRSWYSCQREVYISQRFSLYSTHSRCRYPNVSTCSVIRSRGLVFILKTVLPHVAFYDASLVHVLLELKPNISRQLWETNRNRNFPPHQHLRES